MTRILSYQDIKNLPIPLTEILEAIKDALVEHALKKVYLSPKVTLRPSVNTFYTAMPGGIDRWGYMGTKTIQRVENPEDGPSVKGTLILNNKSNGQLLSVMDATWLTSIRTGAIAALTAKYLSKSNVKRIGIIGLGNTAMATLSYLSYIYPDLKDITALNYKDHAIRISNRFPHYTYTFVDEIKDIFYDSDIVITAVTFAEKAFVNPEWLTPGLLAIPIHMRGWQDCDSFFDKIYTDDHEHIRSWMPKVNGELGSVILGMSEGRSNDLEKIIAYNYGIAIDDIAIAKVIYEYAIKNNVGIDINIENFDSRYYV